MGKIYDKPDQYAKDFIKIKFESSGVLPLNKPLKFHSLTLILKCIFKEENKYYPQFFRWMFVWVMKMWQYERIDVSEGTDLAKVEKSKECEVYNYNYFNNGFKFDSIVCNDCNSGIIAFGLQILQ